MIGNGALVFDVEIVPDDQSESHVELLIEESRLEYNNMCMNWSAAEHFCVSKGGHLASVASFFHWKKLNGFIANNGLDNERKWLGGINEGKKREWAWIDGSKWSEGEWVPGWSLRESENRVWHRNRDKVVCKRLNLLTI